MFLPNRLADQSSPYLRQHADNPVDWYPWGEEAMTRAREEDKPIFLSIGYAACHWCHVMERESFEDPETAAVMNEHFVNIKVDREERPDIDGIYMQAVVGMTGHGGWPMSVWLTPDQEPFHAGTYFPPVPRHGMPSFRQVLGAITDAWQQQRDRIQASAGRLADALRQSALQSATEETVDLGQAEAITDALAHGFDPRSGGWGTAPKFPQPMALEFLLRVQRRTPTPSVLHQIELTLDHMAAGGIYDQLGGGFHRYSTDAAWLVPHFEKMLYDNSQLARMYLHAWQVTGRKDYRSITEDILDYVLREMQHPTGGFYSTQDADSEGEEGRFFVWSLDELDRVAGTYAAFARAAYGASRGGNWEGSNILIRAGATGTLTEQLGITAEESAARLEEVRHRLWEARERRVKPGRDEKVLTAWNGLMLAAFAEAGRALRNTAYIDAAVRNATFLLDALRIDGNRLRRTWKDGSGASLNGYLEDYSHLIEGLLALYQATFEPRWFEAARNLAEAMITHFRADAGGFFDTSDDHEQLVSRPRELQDSAVPSGNAMAATVLFKLAAFSGEARYHDLAEETLALVAGNLARAPLAHGQWLVAYDLMTEGITEVVIVGDPAQAETRLLLEVVDSGFRPTTVVALKEPEAASPVPLLEGREMVDGKATAYVCERFACQRPVTTAGELREQLGERE